MKVSIITVCYNSEAFIKDAIQSVINQTYDNIEYIIIDGKSTDSTLQIIHSFGTKITKVISEPDKGIYDAMNKGILAATGDIIGILNSDDLYMHTDVIANIVNTFKQYQTDSVHADLLYVKTNDTTKTVRYWQSKPFRPDSFKQGWHPAHPTFFVKKNIYGNLGIFNLNFPLAADFELMLRFLEKNHISSHYLAEPIIKMRLGGATNKHIKNIIKQNIECYRAFKINNLPVSILYPLLRLAPKLKQFFNH